jgi:hypothetical protein
MLRFVEAPKEFCGQVDYTPNVRFQNLATTPMTSLSLQLFVNGTLTETRQWTGNAVQYQSAGIVFNAVTMAQTNVLEVKITAVNGQADDSPDNNSISTTVAEGPAIASNFLKVELKTDYYPREIYWEIVDDWGDGINEPGYIKMTDGKGNLLFNFRPRYTGDTYLIDAQFGPSATHDIRPSSDLQLSPNPATDHLDLVFSGWKNSGELRLEVSDFTGKTLRNLALPAGTAQSGYSLDLAGFANGVYCLLLKTNDGESLVKRFVVVRK